MQTIKSLFSCLLVLVAAAGLVCLTDSALAQESGEALPTSEAVQQGSVDGIHYLTGGVGLEEREEIKQRLAEDYNLKLAFATEGGKYLAYVSVVIRNMEGESVFQMVSKGPWLYVKLPPGEYVVEATEDVDTIRKEVQVTETAQTKETFYWDR